MPRDKALCQFQGKQIRQKNIARRTMTVCEWMSYWSSCIIWKCEKSHTDFHHHHVRATLKHRTVCLLPKLTEKILYLQTQKDVRIWSSLCQSISTVQTHQRHICLAHFPTEKIRCLINKWEGGTKQGCLEKDLVLLGGCRIFRTRGILT